MAQERRLDPEQRPSRGTATLPDERHIDASGETGNRKSCFPCHSSRTHIVTACTIAPFLDTKFEIITSESLTERLSRILTQFLHIAYASLTHGDIEYGQNKEKER